MRLRGLTRLGRAVRGLRNRLISGAFVLLYHRVAETETDPLLLGVSPRHFAEQTEVLRKMCVPLPLADVARRVRSGSPIPRNAAVVTFDDGYSDNLHLAKPLLEKHEVPASVFVTTGYVGKEREFWWDELDRILLQPGRLPEKLQLQLHDDRVEWDLGEAAGYSTEAFERHCRWNVCAAPPGARQRCYRVLQRQLRTISDASRCALFDRLLKLTESKPPRRTGNRAMTIEEVRDLCQSGLVEAGAHTVTHPVLSALSTPEQLDEVRRSKARLEEILGSPVAGFAYPYGSRADYTPETVAIVREAGFAYACANFEGLASRHSDVYQLPRLLVRDWDGDEFARNLQEWQCA